jgi:hypothetical protein
MLLPQLMVRDDSRYKDFAKRVTTLGTGYVIMDNGAYEAADTFPHASLVAMAQTQGVDELVIPDVLGSMEGTLGRLHQFDAATVRIRHKRRLRYMFVAQGRDMSECLESVRQAVEATNFITTIGLPKHLVKTVAGTARVVLAARIHARFPHLDIHFLGSAPSWPDEILQANHVRSMDTSMPFAFAWHGKAMDADVIDGCERPSDYFDRPASEFPAELVQQNINKMVEWMNA